MFIRNVGYYRFSWYISPYKSSILFNLLVLLAPEVVNYEPLTCATDMWNIGVLIYVLVTGHTPFGGTTKLDTQNNITHCVLDFPKDLFEKISNQCLDLIQHLIVRIPKYEHLFYISVFFLFFQ
jgi:serine/threonine protein kinase